MATESKRSNRKTVRKASGRELLAVNMIRLRAERGWSQDALSLECGLHRTFIAHVETLRRNISLDNIELIAPAFEVEIRDLFAPLATPRAVG